MTDSRNRLSDGACSHHVLLIDGAKDHHVSLNDGAKCTHVFLNDGANGPHAATLDGAFSPHVQDVSQRARAVTVTSKKGGSAQEVKLSLSGITNDRENDSLAEPKIKPSSS